MGTYDKSLKNQKELRVRIRKLLRRAFTFKSSTLIISRLPEAKDLYDDEGDSIAESDRWLLWTGVYKNIQDQATYDFWREVDLKLDVFLKTGEIQVWTK